ncbi:hypothetical protein MMC22_008612 [Lobaria immixta]|nr:hypothetical protein [Lobaria immixta]
MTSFAPVVTPPPGVTPNFDAPNPNGTALIVVSIIAIVCTTTVVAARLYTKAFLTRALGWDDLGLLGIGTEDYNWRPTIKSYEKYSEAHWSGECTYFVTVGLMKASILLLYLRIFSNSRNLRFAVYAALATVVASHIGTLIVTTFDLRPLKCHWIYILTDEEWDAMCAEYWDDDIAYMFMSVFTIVLDILILAIPCPAVWKLNMPKRQKIGVMIIFSAGLVVTFASLLRLIFIIQWTYFNPNEEYFLIWEFKVNISGIFEINLGIICASVSTLKAFMKRFAPAVLRLVSSHPVGGATSQSQKRSINAHSSSRHLSKPGRSRPIDSGEEELTHAAYLELGEDGKSDQSYGMTAVEVQPRSS